MLLFYFWTPKHVRNKSYIQCLKGDAFSCPVFLLYNPAGGRGTTNRAVVLFLARLR